MEVLERLRIKFNVKESHDSGVELIEKAKITISGNIKYVLKLKAHGKN